MNVIREVFESMTEKEVSGLYSALNQKGIVFSVGQDGQNLRDAAKDDEFTIWASWGTGDQTVLAMSNDIGENFLLADCNGAWAVPVLFADLGVTANISREAIAPTFPEHVEEIVDMMVEELEDAGYDVRVNDGHVRNNEWAQQAVENAWMNAANRIQDAIM